MDIFFKKIRCKILKYFFKFAVIACMTIGTGTGMETVVSTFVQGRRVGGLK